MKEFQTKINDIKKDVANKENQQVVKDGAHFAIDFIENEAAEEYAHQAADRAIEEAPEVLEKMIAVVGFTDKAMKAYEAYQKGTLNFEQAFDVLKGVADAASAVKQIVSYPLNMYQGYCNTTYLAGVNDHPGENIEERDFMVEVAEEKRRQPIIDAFNAIQSQANAEFITHSVEQRKGHSERWTMM